LETGDRKNKNLGGGITLIDLQKKKAGAEIAPAWLG